MTGQNSGVKRALPDLLQERLKAVVVVVVMSILFVGCTQGNSPTPPLSPQPQTITPPASTSTSPIISATNTTQPTAYPSPTQTPILVWLPLTFQTKCSASTCFQMVMRFTDESCRRTAHFRCGSIKNIASYHPMDLHAGGSISNGHDGIYYR